MAHIILRATDVSSLCNRHVYKSADATMREIVQGFHPNVKTAIDRFKTITAELETSIRLGKFYNLAVHERVLSKELCKEAERECMNICDTYFEKCPLSPGETKRIRRGVRTIYLKDRGLYMEREILDRLATETDIQWKPCVKNTRFFSRTFLHPQFTYTINGTVDAFEFSDDVPSGVIEVKSRKDRLQYHMHEIDQIMMYLVISGLKTGRLVQDVRGQIDTAFIMTLDEAEERWDVDVRPVLEKALHKVCHQVRELSKTRANAWRPFRKTDVFHHVFG